MKNKLIDELKDVHPKYRIRHINKSQELTEICSQLYPNAHLNIVVYCLFHGGEPYCTVCGSPVKFQGKKTCSTKCRGIAQIDRHPEIAMKRKKTCLEKYGVDNPALSEEFQAKRVAAMYEKYGSGASPKARDLARSRSEQLNSKGRITLQERYGVSNAGKLPGNKDKIKQTLLKKYGVDNYYKSEEYLKLNEIKRYEKWTSVFPDNIEILNISKNKIKEELFTNPNFEIDIHCSICDNTESLPTETAKWRVKNTGTPCVVCGNISQGSLKQQKLYEFIVSLGVRAKQNFKLSNNTEIDVFCPEYNIGFEFDGLFWHNDLRKDKKYHLLKTKTANDQGIFLVHIFEDEWDHKIDIVKSRIKNLLGFSSNKLFARKCIIKPIDKQLEKEFLDNNHIQGYANSKLAVGLFHDNVLVSMMSFQTPNKAKGQKQIQDNWELLRYCSKLDHNIVGGASRLFSFFIKTNNPESILSFADKRWSIGNLYKELGFEQQRDTAVNYWYIDIKNGKRIYRYKLRKNKSDIQELSEYENRLKQGYLRIWDCGHAKFVWTKKSSP